MKVCNKCNYGKSLDRFEIMKSGYARPTCKDCYNERRRSIQGGAAREAEIRHAAFSKVLDEKEGCILLDRFKKPGDPHHTLTLSYKGFEWETRQTSFVKGVFPWVNHNQKSLHGKKCIYKFVAANGEVLYVGKSIKLPYRLSQHFSPRTIETEKSVWKHNVAKVLYLELQTYSDMHIAEMYLIDKLKPTHNKQAADCDGTTFEIPLPEFKEIWVRFVYDK